MGSSNTRKKLITIEDLDNSGSSMEHIDKIFEANNNGFIIIEEFSRLLDSRLNDNILKKLYSYFCFEKKSMNKDDLKYFYFIFTTNETNFKINFICDLIFKKNKKKFIKYQEKVFSYFSQLDEIHRILINDKIKDMIDRSNLEIQKESVKQYLSKNFFNFFKNFSLVKSCSIKDFRIGMSIDKIVLNNSNHKNNNNYQINESLKNEIFYISNNEINCMCVLFNKKRLSQNIENANSEQQTKKAFEIVIDRIKQEFENISSKNDNLFTVAILEKMMSDIEINNIIIQLVSSYLKRKTQKVKLFSILQFIFLSIFFQTIYL